MCIGIMYVCVCVCMYFLRCGTKFVFSIVFILSFQQEFLKVLFDKLRVATVQFRYFLCQICAGLFHKLIKGTGNF
jgi:hypothetical protein